MILTVSRLIIACGGRASGPSTSQRGGEDIVNKALRRVTHLLNLLISRCMQSHRIAADNGRRDLHSFAQHMWGGVRRENVSSSIFYIYDNIARRSSTHETAHALTTCRDQPRIRSHTAAPSSLPIVAVGIVCLMNFPAVFIDKH